MDYSKKNLENPFHKNNRGLKRDEFSAGLKVSCVLLLVLLIGVLYLMLFSSVFNIKQVKVSGLSRTGVTEIENLANEQGNQNRYWIFQQKNLLIFDRQAFRQSLVDKYHFKTVEIKRNIFSRVLKINLNEREFGYIWQEKDKYYYIDKDGFLINELALNLPPTFISSEPVATTSSSTATSSTEATSSTPVAADYFKSTINAALALSSSTYPVIVNIGEEHFKTDYVNIDKVYLEFTNQFNERVKALNEAIGADNETELMARYFIIDKDFNTIKAILNNGLTVYFSTKEDRDSQIKNLLILKKEKADFNKLIKKKIDLRYGDKVYYE